MRSSLQLISPYFYGDEKGYARSMGILLILLSQLLVCCGYLFTQWNRRFYDTLEAKDMDLFLRETGIFLALAVVAYTVLGMIVSAKIANPLVKSEYTTQKHEAAFRYEQVHSLNGDDIKQDKFSQLLSQITHNHQKSYNKIKHFNLWQKSYDQVFFLVPFVVLAPTFFKGLLTLGALMQIRSTFSRIRNAMAYLLDHYAEITELQAIPKRLLEFCNHIGFIQKPQQSKPVELMEFQL